MAYTYTSVIEYKDSDGRFANLTDTPTVTAYDLAGNSIASPTITNIATGVYKVSVTQNDLEDVIFRVVPHVDDQADFEDVAVMQDKVVHVLDDADAKIDTIDGIVDDILVDTGTTIPGTITTMQADLDNPDQYKADVSALALEATLTAIKGAGWTDETLVAIKASIDAGTVDEAAIRSAIGLAAANLDTQLGDIQTDLDSPDQYKADVSALALEATLTAIKGAGWTTETLAAIKSVIDAILVDTGITLDGKITTIDGIVDDILVDTGTTLPAVLDAIKGVGWTDEDLVAIKAAVDAIESAPTPAEIWSAPERRLTMTATEILASVSGSSITQVRGNTWDFEITGVTLDANKQQFAVKRSAGSSDENALLFIDSATGLLRLNGEAVDAEDQGKATLTYNAVTEVLKIHVEADMNAQLPAGAWKYGAQGVAAGGDVSEPYQGDFVITADIVRATE